MPKEMITILTVNYKTSDFIDIMMYSFKKLTKNSYKVIICDNYSSQKEKEKISNIAKKYENIEVIYRTQTKVGSIGHAEAMDILVSKVDTPYFVTMDSDCVFLLKDWDEILINKINKTVKVIGTSVVSNSTSCHKPDDFPLVFAVLYETKVFQRLNPSFIPKNVENKPSQDTGWEIREKYLKNAYESIVFDGVNTRYNTLTPFGDNICAVYYLDAKLIVSHFSRGSSGGVIDTSKIWYKMPIISSIIKKYISIVEKKKWITVCFNIVDNHPIKNSLNE